MDTKLKKGSKSYFANIIGFIIIIIMSISIFSIYPVIKQGAKDDPSIPYEDYEILQTISRSNYVLYKDLLDQKNGEELSAYDVFIKSNDSDLNNDRHTKNIFNNNLNAWKEDLNYSFRNLDYLVYYNDNSLNKTNTDSNLRLLIESNENIKNKYAFYMVIKYDENGMALVENIYGANDYTVRNRFLEFSLRDTLDFNISDENEIKINNIKNTTFIYGIPSELKYSDTISRIIDNSQNNYKTNVISTTVLSILCIILILGLMIPYSKGKEILGIKTFFKIPLEVNCVIFGLGTAFSGLGSYSAVIATMEGNLIYEKINFALSPEMVALLINMMNIILWIIIIYLIFAGDMLLKHIFNTGFTKYLKENLLILKIAKPLKKLIEDAVYYLEHIDLTDKSNKIIIKVLAINFVIITIISVIWFFGFIAAIVYTAVLYKMIRKYVDNVKDKFRILLNATNKIADGNLDVEINEDLGLFNPFKEELRKIHEGFKKAVNEEVKSQRMKTELISNVSHDLKTPLTSIITYVDLLKNVNITDEERKSYIDTIDKKSQRLKVLIEDLFEVSKATSGDIKLNLAKIDIVELMRQIEIELNDKLTASNLNIKNNFPSNKVILELDSQKTFRIFENLLINVIKYSLDGSRVYIDIIDNERSVEITIKNISAEEIDFNALDIVERFERGDKSRNTEGSGLGLAIAKSFVEVQGGTFNIEVDGDLFKVIIVLKK